MTSAGFDRIYQLLRRFAEGRVSSAELDSVLCLVEAACRKDYRLNRWISNSAVREGSDFHSILLSLYGRQLNNDLPGGQLQRAMQAHTELTDPNLFLYFERASRIIMARQLGRQYRELNPTPFRTRSQVMQLLRHDPQLVIYVHRGRPIWFSLRGANDLRAGGLPWTDREILGIIYEVGGRGGRILEMIQSVIREMATRRDHQIVIEIAALVAAIAEWKRETLESGLLAGERSGKETPIQVLIRQEAGRIVLREVTCKVEDHPASNGGAATAALYIKGLTDLVGDLVEFCDRAGHRSYLQPYIPGLTEDKYRQEHRFFDDQATFVKQRFAELLWKN